jgi:hypothetical protein
MRGLPCWRCGAPSQTHIAALSRDLYPAPKVHKTTMVALTHIGILAYQSPSQRIVGLAQVHKFLPAFATPLTIRYSWERFVLPHTIKIYLTAAQRQTEVSVSTAE